MKCSDRMCGADDCERCHPENFDGTVYLHDRIQCPDCGGQGWYMDGPTEDPERCPCSRCSGTGEVIPPAPDLPEPPERDDF